MTVTLEALQNQIGSDKLQFHPPHVWIYRPKNKNIIVKLEQTKNPHMLCVNASFARDGSGPLMASFMSMLLIEDSHATSTDYLGICSGAASITLYHWLDIKNWQCNQLANYLINFEKLALCILPQASKSPSHNLPDAVILNDCNRR